MDALRKEIKELGKSLSVTEVKLVTAEKECQYLKSQIEERERQMEGLGGELIKQGAELARNLGLVERERQEKERLIRKCEGLEETLKANIEARSGLLLVGGDAGDRVGVMESENRRLMGEYAKLSEKLVRTEQELSAFRSESFLVRCNKADKSSPSDLFDVSGGESNDSLKVGLGEEGRAMRWKSSLFHF